MAVQSVLEQEQLPEAPSLLDTLRMLAPLSNEGLVVRRPAERDPSPLMPPAAWG